MGSTKEVVTLQFGHYANFIGTHWWNIQESSFIYDPKLAESKEVNPDVLFREGKNLNKQVTFTPRLIVWDLKGSLHSLRKEGTLYDFRSDRTSGWDGDVTVTKKPRIEKNEFLKDLEKQEKLPSFSSLFIPLSLSSSAWLSRPSAHISYRKFPNAIYKPNLDYHTSAILAACLENSTLPYRLWNKSGHMKDITHSFHGLGRKVGALMAALPFPLGEDSSLVETFMQLDGEMPWTPVSPNISPETKPWMMSSVLRGISEELAMTSNIKPEFAQVLSHCSSVSDVLELFVTELFPGTLNAGCVVTAPCKVVTPYPHIFTPNINSGGLVSTMLRTPMQGVNSIPVMSCIQSTKESGKMVGELYEEAKKINIKRFHRFLSTGLEEDEFKETLNELANLSENYDD
ncbi:Protein misato homolog 1 [Acanthosepion pharaonis]|uniref:Protein misato homolog 1 n=1 Tax=Acanthosepion pharaonis TaxID=158019 RepID=A0A812EUF6_ACAPH|nr:Protein misato homolog 1 [Sepia pharaonis]